MSGAEAAMGIFAKLPEESISEIISSTSRLDAVRSFAVSKQFKCAADSDAVWRRFLPSDLQEIISRSVCPVDFSNSSKKELYFSLCDSPILLDEGNLSFSLDKGSGKKCYMVGARKLIIAWANDSWYWNHTLDTCSRFSDVITLEDVCWMDIRGKIETQMLSPGTTYAAYLVYKIAENSYGLEFASAVIRLVSHESDEEAEIGLQPSIFNQATSDIKLENLEETYLK